MVGLLLESMGPGVHTGHSFGSEHDPHTKECDKPVQEGGKFIMWYLSVLGKHPNNYNFSPCSRRQIGNQVLQKRDSCFIPRSSIKAFCGNGIIEKGEECDAGSYGLLDTNKCCTHKCTLQDGAICSEINQYCCKGCQIAPSSELCFDTGPGRCKSKSYCSGKHLDCPEPENLPDGTPCIDKGQCYNGVCEDFCHVKARAEGISLKSCMCTSNVTAACMWCCFDDSNSSSPGPCVPHSTDILKDDRLCYHGRCKNGVCIQQRVDRVMRLFNFLSHLEVSAMAMFMRTNIVITVIFLSLFLWIPPCIIISRIDEKDRQQREAIERFIAFYKVKQGSASDPSQNKRKDRLHVHLAGVPESHSHSTLGADQDSQQLPLSDLNSESTL